MPLPPPNTPWPPKGHTKVHREVNKWNAWWIGDRDALAAVYGGAAGALPPGFQDRPSQHRGGIVGAAARMFWGQPTRPEQRSPKLHVPIAGEIADTSAQLLFSRPPALTVEDQGTQARLDELFDERAWERLLTAAETCAALGGVYLRVGWDQDVAPRPLLSSISPDMAVPVFRWQTLTEVTFTWTLHTGNDGVLRHLEHHAPGRVEHGLYHGDHDTLGMLLPLTEHPVTAPLAEEVDSEGGIPTGLPRLDVAYTPNTHNPAWRADPVGADQGAADIAGVEPVLDAVDESYTSWMRDVRLGKARILVPQDYLDNHGPGQGASIDLDREVFTPVRALLDKSGMHIEPQQFNIRHQEHAATVLALTERAVTGSGYSAQTFGLTTDVAMTATESYARERRTHNTRGGKVRRWSLGLAELAEIMLAVDRQVFGTSVTPQRPSVEFPDVAPVNPEVTSQTALNLRSAEAASTETLVSLVHPEWDSDEVADEVARIDAAGPDVVEELRRTAGQSR